MSNYNIFILILVISLNTFTPIEAQLVNEIDKIVSQLPSTTTTAIYIFDPVNGDTLYQKNIHMPMIPASNIKLLTTSAALSILGGEYALTTKLFTDDLNPADSIINGNIYLKGFGNSKFSGSDVKLFASHLKKSGIKKITGNLVVDDSYFDTNFSHGNVYIDGQSNLTVPPVSALALDRNTIYLTLITRKKSGDKLDYRFSPTYPFVSLNMDARVTRFQSEPRVSYRFDGEIIKIRVLGGMNQKQKRANYLLYIENPSLYCGLALMNRMVKEGLKLNGELIEGKTPTHANIITAASTTVSELLPEINKNSDNFLAESLFKSIGAEHSNDVGNKYFAGAAIMSFLNEKNILNSKVKIDDGSGISRSNRVTADLMVSLLDFNYNDKINFEVFYNSLSIAGVDGTLKDRFQGTSVQNYFHGKTGTIYGVSTISGYLTTEDNENLIICILMNFTERGTEFHKKIQDEIILYVAAKKESLFQNELK